VASILLELFVSGLLVASGPCMLSCGPILVSYVSGTSKNALQSLLSYVLFSLGRFFIYAFLSAAVFSSGSAVASRAVFESNAALSLISGAVLVVIGLAVALNMRLALPIACRIQQFIFQRQQANAVIIGVISGLAPCIPLLAVLGYIGLISKSWPQSVALTAVFCAGTTFSPLLFVAMASAGLASFVHNRQQKYLGLLRLLSGAVIVFFGLHLIWRSFL
jgi:cytochrome c biogenesis protein CcdA